MKRVEMLNYLTAHLKDLGVNRTPEEIAGLCLFLLEQKGMRPPPIKVIKLRYQNREVLNEGSMSYEKYEWEETFLERNKS